MLLLGTLKGLLLVIRAFCRAFLRPSCSRKGRADKRLRFWISEGSVASVHIKSKQCWQLWQKVFCSGLFSLKETWVISTTARKFPPQPAPVRLSVLYAMSLGNILPLFSSLHTCTYPQMASETATLFRKTTKSKFNAVLLSFDYRGNHLMNRGCNFCQKRKG